MGSRPARLVAERSQGNEIITDQLFVEQVGRLAFFCVWPVVEIVHILVAGPEGLRDKYHVNSRALADRKLTRPGKCIEHGPSTRSRRIGLEVVHYGQTDGGDDADDGDDR